MTGQDADFGTEMQQDDGVTLQTRTTCQLGGVADEWNTADMDCGDEIETAIEMVREDHDHEVVVEGESLWVFTVYWNDNTDSVWVSRFGYDGGMEVEG